MRPANSPYRLQALVKVVEMYEKASDWPKAIAVYEDLARNAPRRRWRGPRERTSRSCAIPPLRPCALSNRMRRDYDT